MIYKHDGLYEIYDVLDTFESLNLKEFNKGIFQAIGYKSFYKFYLQTKDLN